MIANFLIILDSGCLSLNQFSHQRCATQNYCFGIVQRQWIRLENWGWCCDDGINLAGRQRAIEGGAQKCLVLDKAKLLG